MEECWYETGLRFSCTRCGHCCTGVPGYVWVEQEDIEALAEFQQLSVENFCRTYVRWTPEGLSLLEKANGDCVFWQQAGCSVYQARPPQCRAFPFWSSHLGGAATWRKSTESCPGADTGRLYVRDEIDQIMNKDGRIR